MSMIIKTIETGKISGKQSVVFDEKSGNYFTVSSVNNPIASKTFIRKCDENGKNLDLNEVFVVIPENHDGVMELLAKGEITIDNFIFVK